MDLGVSRGNEVVDQLLGLGHRRLRRKVLPGVRAKVVTAEHEPFLRQAVSLRKCNHLVAEVHGSKPGVATVLVHLVAGGLDQHHVVAIDPVPDRLVQHERVGGADRREAFGASGAMAGGQCVEA